MSSTLQPSSQLPWQDPRMLQNSQWPLNGTQHAFIGTPNPNITGAAPIPYGPRVLIPNHQMQCQTADFSKSMPQASWYHGSYPAQSHAIPSRDGSLHFPWSQQQQFPPAMSTETSQTTCTPNYQNPTMPYVYGTLSPAQIPQHNTRSVTFSHAQNAHNRSCSFCKTPLSSTSASTRSSSKQETVAPQPRGPPRKPKRSGHAIWVGNIPLGASIEALKNHFARDATTDIESLFLMSKSNCAFVNYRSQAACTAAVERFNHSLFGSVRLLVRLRQDPASKEDRKDSSALPTPSPTPTPESPSSLPRNDSVLDDTLGASPAESQSQPQSEPKPAAAQDRYFILKSLTPSSLQASLHTGSWETQAHNEPLLDAAFHSSQAVFLIFSANKSGEYFGYARMLSSPLENAHRPTILHSSAAPAQNRAGSKKSEGEGTENKGEVGDLRTGSSSNNGGSGGALKISPTAATQTAPEGYVIEDPSRGTLFWEACASASSSDPSSSSPSTSSSDPSSSPSLGPPASQLQALPLSPRPFRIEWLSVRRVGFARAKGLKNAWNRGKEVKIARDGTELETETGRRVVGLFHEGEG